LLLLALALTMGPARTAATAAALVPVPLAILSPECEPYRWQTHYSSGRRNSGGEEIMWKATTSAASHQHTFQHAHWHTHVLEDDLVVHHYHPHRHAYRHTGADCSPAEVSTRVSPDRERAEPTDEYGTDAGGTTFWPGAAR